MPAPILGPTLGAYPVFPAAHAPPYQAMRPPPRMDDIEIGTTYRTIRLLSHTLSKYLPGLWDDIRDGVVGRITRRGYVFVDTESLPDLRSHEIQEGLAQLFKHLEELERTDGHSSVLLHWLEAEYQRSRQKSALRHGHAGLDSLTRSFAGLAKAMDQRRLGSHRKLFQIMANFLIKNSKEVSRLATVGEFMRLIYSLDRMGHDMNEALSAIVSALGNGGRRRLRHHDEYSSDSSYSQLSSDTRRVLRKLLDPRRSHDGGRRSEDRHVVPFRHAAPRDAVRDAVRLGAAVPGRNRIGVVPRHQVRALKRQLGPNVRFQSWAPNDHVFYRVVDGAVGHHHHHHHHHPGRAQVRPRRQLRIADRGMGPRTASGTWFAPGAADMTLADEDDDGCLYDDGDSSSSYFGSLLDYDDYDDYDDDDDDDDDDDYYGDGADFDCEYNYTHRPVVGGGIGDGLGLGVGHGRGHGLDHAFGHRHHHHHHHPDLPHHEHADMRPRVLPRRVSFGSLEDAYRRLGLGDAADYDVGSDVLDDGVADDNVLFGDDRHRHLHHHVRQPAFLRPGFRPRSRSWAYYSMAP